jgi:hypothetical protein
MTYAELERWFEEEFDKIRRKAARDAKATSSNVQHDSELKKGNHQ